MHKFVGSSDEKAYGSKFGTQSTVAKRSSGSNLGSSAGAGTPATIPVPAAAGGGGGGDGIASTSSKPRLSKVSTGSKASRSDNGSRKSRRSSYGLESLMSDEFGEVKFVGYNINKWILYHNLGRDIKIIKQKVSELYKTSGVGKHASGATPSKDVSDYWENTGMPLDHGEAPSGASSKIQQKKKLDAVETQALLILQSQFRLWLTLASMRRQTQYNGFNMSSKIGSVQNAIRRFHAVREVRLAEANMLLSADLFTEFCTLMVAGVQILMYSKKHGSAVKRSIKFTDGMCGFMCMCVCVYVCMYVIVYTSVSHLFLTNVLPFVTKLLYTDARLQSYHVHHKQVVSSTHF
jgi:hypothetical protein